MKDRVLLISMPFADVSIPSLALSQLKAIVQEEAGLPCDVLYLNMAFRNFTDHPEIYDRVSTYTLFGEWPFGEDLFGSDWAKSDRGGAGFLDTEIPLGLVDSEPAKSDLILMRTLSGPFLDKWMDDINLDAYNVIGFTSVFFQQVASLALAKRIKQVYPEKMIAFGGANCNEATEKALLRLFPFIDWIFSGQADASLSKAVQQWIHTPGKPPAGISGISYRDNGAIITQGSGEPVNLDRLPFPEFQEFTVGLKKWVSDIQTPTISLEFSRGCWWGDKSQCVFCGVNHKTLSFRGKSPERAELEIQSIVERYGIKRICVTDSILQMAYFRTLLPSLAKKELLQDLFVETKANLNRKQVRLLKSAGVHRFQPGIESLDTELLAYMRKGTTLLKNVQLLKWTREYNVDPVWNLLYGFPGESQDAYRRMALIIPTLSHLKPPGHFGPVKLQRFSVLFNQRRNWGIRDVVAAKMYTFLYPFEQQDLDEIAYYFNCEFDGKDEIPAYTELLKGEVETWQNVWKDPEPPLLAFKREGEKGSGERITIYDGRSCATDLELQLNEEMSAIYLSCDKQQRFESLTGSLRRQMGKKYPGDDSLKKHLDDLIERHLMLHEHGLYLSLANDMDILGKYGGSMLACLFFQDEK